MSPLALQTCPDEPAARAQPAKFKMPLTCSPWIFSRQIRRFTAVRGSSVEIDDNQEGNVVR
jgi:hypothetical protein